MKKKLFFGLLTFGIFAAGCSNDNLDKTENESAKSALQVTINSDATSSRATGEPTQDQENKVKGFTVYIFNNTTDALEKKEKVEGTLSKTINDLSLASSKKVVVLVNEPEDFPSITNYTQLTTAYLKLDSQNELKVTDGGVLFMSGEAAGAVTLKKSEIVTVPITVRRLVAKVKLGGITIIPEGEDVTLDKFVLGGVSIQHARENGVIMGNGIQNGNDISYVQGIVSYSDYPGVVEKAYLNEFVSLPSDYIAGNKFSPEEGIYFYVFPNNAENDKATLLTVYGHYDGKPVFYPFRINYGSQGGADGTFIQRNKIYTLNVTLKKLASGGEEPNIPNDEVSMNLEVNVANWEGSLEQDVEW